jgi:pimeloyl-ACP methyl ester carboxylesterase
MPTNAKEKSFKSFDGTKIAYRQAGKGKKTILCFNGLGVAKWIWFPFEKYFGDRYKIITWDYRGHGLSGKPKKKQPTTFDHIIEDGLELIKHLKIKKALLVGHSAGFQLALEIHRRKPKLATGLVSCMGTPGKSLETFMESFVGQLVFDVGYILNAVLPETAHFVNSNLLYSPATYQLGAALKLVNPAIDGRDEIKKYCKHITTMDFALFNQIVATSSKQSADDLLPKIKLPTLLIASEYDRFIPISIAKKMHSKIKKSKLFVIKNGTHAALLEQPDIFNLVIEKFLN